MKAPLSTDVVGTRGVGAPGAPRPLDIIPRRSGDRGHADHGWLKTYHTFSFADYFDPRFEAFGPLRVINEDRVAPGQGFGKHSHRGFEIWSYVVDGELEHRDSMGNLEVLKRGQIQMTSTGTGISHSEFNRHRAAGVHFLQIWALPGEAALAPRYYTRYFSDEEKRDKLAKVVATASTDRDVVDEREASGPTPVHSHLTMCASILSPGVGVVHTLAAQSSRAYLHLIMRSGYRGPTAAASESFADGGAKVRVDGGLVLEEGDGCFIEASKGQCAEVRVENAGGKDAEWLLFEME